MVFYDNHGRPTAYTEDDIHIYLFTGEPVAYIDRDAVYGYNGKHLGWFSNGWIRDLNGCCVFFSEKANGCGPVKPIKYICPVCGCVWLASEDESRVENLYSYDQIVAQSFYCDCPDCFQRRVEGQKLKAIVAKEGER